ncbi:MAG TPA: hypothetical protein VHO90_18700 [Bacteroidales bacterium]|nr:hypothetical protein [Bacteroidales bacterium]
MLKIDLYHPERQKLHSHFANLVRLAKADGILDDSEHQYLYKLGKRINMTPEEVDVFISKPLTDAFIPPFELEEKFEQLHDMIAVILADGTIDQAEKKLCRSFIIGLGFEDSKTDKIIEVITRLINEKLDHDTAFERFRKEVFRR